MVAELLIGDYQIGFKKGARTETYTETYYQWICRKPDKTLFMFVDFQKAYDNVWREGLYYKLLNPLNSGHFELNLLYPWLCKYYDIY